MNHPIQIDLDPHPIPRRKKRAPVQEPSAMESQPAQMVALLDVAIWNPTAAAFWSLLFTPIFGAYLQATNWETLGHRDQARKAWQWFYGSIVVMASLLTISTFNVTTIIGSVKAQIVAYAYMGVWYLADGRAQGRFVKKQWGRWYPRRTWGEPLLIAIGVYTMLIVLAVGVRVASIVLGLFK